MAKTHTFSYSELDAYRQCRHKHQLAYRERWGKETDSPALLRGSLFHSVLQAHYNELRLGGRGGLPERPSPLLAGLDVVVKAEAEGNEHAELVEWIYRGHTELYGYDPQWEIVEVEKRFEIWLPTDRGTRSSLKLKGFVDLVVRWRGDLWVVDHKTCKNLPKDRETDLDDQMGLYVYLLRRAGLPIRGAIMNYCRTERLKTREMDADERFRRILTFRTDAELETIMREARELMGEAYRRRGEAPRSPNPDTCRWRCDFTEACLAGRKGLDERGFLRDGGYVEGLERR